MNENVCEALEKWLHDSDHLKPSRLTRTMKVQEQAD